MAIITQQQALIAVRAEREQAHLHRKSQLLGNPTAPFYPAELPWLSI
ncbi:MAG: hypothetical protein ACFNUE_06355 [Bacteroides sp.]